MLARQPPSEALVPAQTEPLRRPVRLQAPFTKAHLSGPVRDTPPISRNTLSS